MADQIGVVRDLTWDKSGGILLETITPGEGEEGPRIGDRVFVHYTGMLKDDTVFDSTSGKNDSVLQFTLGKGEVIKALDCAIANMRKGETARITCAAEYGYGKNGMPPKIPPDATLIYTMNLIDWKGTDLTKAKDGGIIKRMVKQGERLATPNQGAMVTIKYTAYHEDRKVESREVTFIQGEGDEEDIIPGLEMATRKMKKGEQDRLTIAPKYAYGEGGCPELSIPSNATLVYEVEMVNFEKAKEAWDMDPGQKIEQCKIIKEKGTKYFKKGNYSRASSNYKKILSFLEKETSGLCGNEPAERVQLMLAAYLNLAMCNLKLQNFCDVEDSCNEVLKMDANNVKALFRRGQSRLERCDYSTASEDFRRVVELEPENKAARNQLALCKKKQKEAYNKEKELYSSMFHKMAVKSGGGFNLYQTMPDVGEWNNDMAKNMMPLQEERDAFEDGADLDKKDLIPGAN